MALGVRLRLTVALRVTDDHLRGLRQLVADHPVGRRIVVSCESKPRLTEDGIEILPAVVFARRLADGELLQAIQRGPAG